MRKLVNKIFALIGLVISFMIIAFLVYFKAFAEVTPSPVSVTKLTQELEVDKFIGITNGRGLWRIVVEQADTQSVAINCGDNLFDNYLDARIENGVLVLDLTDEFTYENTALMDVQIKSPYINKILARKFSMYWLKKVKYDSLDVHATGASLIVLDTCDVNNLSIFAKGKTSMKSIGSNIGTVNYNISEDNITEFSKQPDNNSGVLTGNAFIKVKDRSILSPEKESEFSQFRIKSFPGLPVFENEKELSKYMKLEFGVVKSEVYSSYDKNGNPYLKYLFSHLGRIAMTSQGQSFSGGRFAGQDVYAWQFYFVRGTISKISIFYPENSNLDTLFNNITKTYGIPDNESSQSGHYSASWNHLFSGIDSSLSVQVKQGVDGSIFLGFQLWEPELERIALEKEWMHSYYYRVSGIYLKKIIESVFIGNENRFEKNKFRTIPFFLN